MRRLNLLFSVSLLLFLSIACGDTDDDNATPEKLGLGDGGETSVIVPNMGSGGEGGDGDAPAGGLELCSVNGVLSQGDPSGDLMIDDFDDGDAAISENGLAGGWFAYDDGSAGAQTPSGAWAPEAGGVKEGGMALHVSGAGFTVWGAGQGATLASLGVGQPCLFDASAYDGISLWIKGSVEPDPDATVGENEHGAIRFSLVEKYVTPISDGGRCDPQNGSCWDAHRVRLSPDACWRKLSFTFDEFAPDGYGVDGGELDLDELYTFSLEISQQQTYDYWVDEIQFFVGEKPEIEVMCADGLGGAGGGPT